MIITQITDNQTDGRVQKQPIPATHANFNVIWVQTVAREGARRIENSPRRISCAHATLVSVVVARRSKCVFRCKSRRSFCVVKLEQNKQNNC